MDSTHFVAAHMDEIGASGIRRVFELGATLEDPINLSIGQPDFPVPEPVKVAAVKAIDNDLNGYTVTRGLPQLRELISKQLKEEFNWECENMVTCGVSGGLFLALLACMNPGDELLFHDPYFVSYPYLTRLSGGTSVKVPLYDDLQLDPDAFERAITKKTKAILLCSPGNPTGIVFQDEQIRKICDLAKKHDLLIISDEIYNLLCYDGKVPSPVTYAPERTLLMRGLGKSYGMTGWRMGYVAGPAAIIDAMSKLQQYTFVCAPQPFQHAALSALETDMSEVIDNYRGKRDLACDQLKNDFDFVRPSGGFYLFPKVPEGYESGTAFVEKAIENNVLIIPGEVFSDRDTHFRISYAAPDEKIIEGCRILKELASRNLAASS